MLCSQVRHVHVADHGQAAAQVNAASEVLEAVTYHRVFAVEAHKKTYATRLVPQNNVSAAVFSARALHPSLACALPGVRCRAAVVAPAPAPAAVSLPASHGDADVLCVASLSVRRIVPEAKTADDASAAWPAATAIAIQLAAVAPSERAACAAGATGKPASALLPAAAADASAGDPAPLQPDMSWLHHHAAVAAGCPTIKLLSTKLTYLTVVRWLALQFTISGLLIKFFALAF
jgi:hypothetical protein